MTEISNLLLGRRSRARAAESAPQAHARLDRRSIALCVLVNLVAGASVVPVSYAAPLIVEQWGLDERTLGLVFSSGLAGMTVGALALAPLSDILGRKTMILVAILMIAAGMAASSLATGVGMLVALRFGIGLGVGSALAGAAALAAEHAPQGRRALAVSIATAGYPLAAVASGFAASVVLPAYGWPGLFLGASAVAALAFPLCARWMRESAEHLLVREAASRSGQTAAPPLGELLGAGRRRETALLWVAFFTSFITLYFLVSWIPSMGVEAGLRLEHAIYGGATYHMGSIAGHALLGWLSSRFSLTILVAVFFGLAGLLLPLCGMMHAPLGLYFAEIFVIGVLAQGGLGGLYALAARLYPTGARVTGMGWTLSVGRLGGVAGPYLGGVVAASGVGLFGNLLIFALPLIAAGLAAAAIKPASGP